MLYPKSRDRELSEALFKNPTAEYRGAPFWAWNGELDRETLSRQIDMMRQMGFGGFHMHVRTGMDTPYLSAEFMDHILFCVDRAKRRDMLAWLYDEDRWPSGTAGGRVTAEHPEYAKKQLLFTPFPYDEDRPARPAEPRAGWGGGGRRYENGKLLARYDVFLDAEGKLEKWTYLPRKEGEEKASAPSVSPEGGVRWYAYLESATDDPWFNDHPYADLLDPAAVRAFMDVTHEAYAASAGAEFGKTIPAIFTDEPQYTHKGCLPFPGDRTDVFIPWTEALAAEYGERYGGDLMETLPCLFWESGDGTARGVRWKYQNLLADLFTENYCRQVGRWCGAHGLYLTGHVNGEETLKSQTGNVGDAMRCYPEFGIPGIDMLCDAHQYNTAKQAQSVARQEGKEGMLSELYGVTGWDYDFRGYKLQGDWQAALGVTVRVPHLTWMTMKGEAKRDYPASIGYQSPWWDRFSLVEDHFARLNTALVRGGAVAGVGVIHPIESYWMLWGPAAQTHAAREKAEKRFAELTETLLFGQIDFDFISEALLPGQCPEASAPLRVGRMEYRTVLVPGCLSLRRSTLGILEAFKNAGGRLIFLGDCPAYADGEVSDAARGLYERSERLPFDENVLLDALEEERFLDIRRADGSRADSLLYQLRRDGEGFWLFVANGKNPASPDVDPAPVCRFTLKGEYDLTVYDTLTGRIAPFGARASGGRTEFRVRWHMHDSLLLRLLPRATGREDGAEETGLPPLEEETPPEPREICGPVRYTLDEDNMLLLDLAEWALDDEPWRKEEEILRLDNLARDALGFPRRKKAVKQPYLLEKEKPGHTLRLRFRVPSLTALDSVSLGLEEDGDAAILWNGREIPFAPTGWFVDRCIRTVPLGSLNRGENVLEVRFPFGRRTNPECMYLLGAFGVSVAGTVKTVTRLPDRLGFGDIVPQGLPFYTGNLQYHLEDVETDGGSLTVRVPHYRGALVSVLVDGIDRGPAAFSPYALTVSGLEKGKHRVTLRLYGWRQNGFAQLHHTPGVWFYQSPDSWRSRGDLWRYEYSFKPMGILKAPEITTRREGE